MRKRGRRFSERLMNKGIAEAMPAKKNFFAFLGVDTSTSGCILAVRLRTNRAGWPGEVDPSFQQM